MLGKTPELQKIMCWRLTYDATTSHCTRLTA